MADDETGTAECAGEDFEDGGVAADEGEVGEVALGGVEPGVEEGCGVDGGGGGEDCGDGVD